MRSSSAEMYTMPISRRRSRATGCWVAMTEKHCSRCWRYSSFSCWSLPRTRSARSGSRLRSAFRASAVWDSSMDAIRSRDSLRDWSSRSKVSLAKSARDVALCALILRPVEEVRGWSEFDQLPVAVLAVHEHEGCEIGDAGRLLHVVGDDHDGVV